MSKHNLIDIGRMRLLLLLVAVLGHGDEEPVDAQLAVQLQRLLHRFLLVECDPHYKRVTRLETIY